MAATFISSRALCAGLQSTETTWRAPCSSRLRLLSPPLVSVRHTSSDLMSSTCRGTTNQFVICPAASVDSRGQDKPIAHISKNSAQVCP